MAQRGIAGFVTWCEDPEDEKFLLTMFREAPTDLTTAISCTRPCRCCA